MSQPTAEEWTRQVEAMGRAAQRVGAHMREEMVPAAERMAESFGSSFRAMLFVQDGPPFVKRTPLWSRWTLGERELQRDRRPRRGR